MPASPASAPNTSRISGAGERKELSRARGLHFHQQRLAFVHYHAARAAYG